MPSKRKEIKSLSKRNRLHLFPLTDEILSGTESHQLEEISLISDIHCGRTETAAPQEFCVLRINEVIFGNNKVTSLARQRNEILHERIKHLYDSTTMMDDV